MFKEVASSSLEVGASKAQESLESVGQAFDSIGSVVWKSTAQIIAQGTESDLDDGYDSHGGSSMNHMNSPVGRYNRYDVQLRGIQCDVNTYVEEFEDAGDFEKWRLGFNLDEKKDEIGNLMAENGTMEGIYKRVVPNVVEHDLFWSRYYYRVYKLEQAESVRAKLVERANEDEDLSWDVDDEEENDNNNDNDNDNDNDDNVVEKKEVIKEDEEGNKEMKEGDLVAKECLETTNEVKSEEEMVKKTNVDEKAASEVSKDSDISVVSSQPSSRGEEEDLGWDEIEDLGSDDDEDVKKGKRIEGSSSSPSNKEELLKRLSVAEDDDEDLSWDIEDDDEPIKKS